MRNKGKVYPTPSSSSSSASASASPLPASSGDSFSIFNLLPAAILALAAVLSLEEREVLAYLITRSIKSTNPSVKNKKKSLNTTHKPPVFDCECFACYTRYWFIWDSSPNRELIHQAIEAFEDHLNNGEHSKKKGKKRVKMGHRRLVGKLETPPPDVQETQPLPELELELEAPALQEKEELNDAAEEEEWQPPGVQKGWARTVLPEVLGLFISRLWNLWSPNV